jgi:predicted TPR repeat methyltransferase
MPNSSNTGGTGQVSIAQAMDIALSHANEGRFDEARDIYRKVLSAEPRNLQALQMQAIVSEQLGDNTRAIKLFKKALKIDGSFADARYNLGNLYLRAGQYKMAEACYRLVTKQAPDFASAFNNSGLAMRHTGKFEEAEACFKRALELEPDAAYILNNLGNLCGDTLRPDEAENCYTRAIKAHPHYVDSHINLGKLFNDTQRYDEAANSFRQALTLSPEHADAHNNLAIALREAGHLEQAIEHAREAIRLDPGPAYPFYIMGKLMEQTGQPDQAIEAYRSCLERDPSDSFGAGLSLAHLGAHDIPREAPGDYLDLRYAKKARTWDQSIEGDTPYRGPALITDMLARMRPAFDGLDVLDAGCGTGLVGGALKGRAGSLIGVDLSQPMLDQAHEKNLYDRLHQGDLVKFLNKKIHAYDIILSAATLIYFGDLTPVFTAAVKALRPGGVFIFTAFPSEGEDISVTAFSCYAHSQAYIHQSASAAGFTVELLDVDIHEYKEGEPVNGLVVGLSL